VPPLLLAAIGSAAVDERGCWSLTVRNSPREAATANGEIRGDISPEELLHAVGNLCLPGACEGPAYSQRMVALLSTDCVSGRDKNLRNDRQPPAVARISYLWISLPRRHPAGK
jgi:hypothetical protein